MNKMNRTDNKPEKESRGKQRRPPVIGMSREQLEQYALAAGFPAFHGKQVFNWVYGKQAESFRSMTDLPEKLRKLLDRDLTLDHFTPARTAVSRDGSATKHLFVTGPEEGIEAVVLADSRKAFCISSQVGCPVGCLYCATGRCGFARNLTAGEIVCQVLSLARLHGKPDSILYMGMGEPLLNLKEVLASLSLLEEAGFSHRKITVSTCGIIGGIYALADSGLRPRLAVSVGSSLEDRRRKIIPASHVGSLHELERAIGTYREKTGRRVSLEYTLTAKLNDTREEARALASLARRTGSHVNLIRYNPSGHGGLAYPAAEKMKEFRKLLADAGAEVTERYRRGTDIRAACGQLVSRTPSCPNQPASLPNRAPSPPNRHASSPTRPTGRNAPT